MLDEIQSEERWQAAFANSQYQLAALGREVPAEYRSGKTRKLDPDTL